MWQCTYACLDPKITAQDTRVYLHQWFQDSFPTVEQMEQGITGSFRVPAMGSLLTLHIVLRRFVERFGYHSPYPEEEGHRSEERLLTLARQFSESPEQFTRWQDAHRGMWETLVGQP